MGRKGQKDCCCDNCGFKPAFAAGGISPIEQLCCSCLPKEVCVSVSVYETGASGSTYLDACDGVPSLQYTVYEGILTLQNTVIDLQFSFKFVNQTCYFCVTSNALHISQSTPNACVLIDAAARDKPNYFCQRFWVNGHPIRWTFSTSLGTTTISIGAANNTAITGRQPCLDAYGNEVLDTDPIRNVCAGCGCICTCGVMIIQYRGATTVEAACRSGVNWTTGGSYPYVVTLQPDPHTRNCQLALTQTGSIPVSSLPAAIGISGSNQAHPCPRPMVKYSGFDTSGRPYFITFVCDPCENGAVVQDSQCCQGELPRVLTATISSPDGTCACSVGTSVPMIYDEMFSAWIGTVPGGFCGSDITLTFSCGGLYWALVFQSNPCIVQSETHPSQVCYPLHAQFNLGLAGLGCCQQVSGVHNIVITVTE